MWHPDQVVYFFLNVCVAVKRRETELAAAHSGQRQEIKRKEQLKNN